MSAPIPLSVDGCAAVGLDELQDVASLQTRFDRKYLIPESAVPCLVSSLHDDTAVLCIDGDRVFSYESLYFDTPDLQSYTLTARRRPTRFKVRVRTYESSGLCMLEVKRKNGRSATVKDRTAHPLDERDCLTEAGGRFVDAVTGMALSTQLLPQLNTAFWRTTLLDRSDGSRTTIDQNLTWHVGAGPQTSLPGQVVVESKTLGTASAIDRWLWSHGHRPVTISKYCIGMALHDPSLPAHKWNRLLRHTFGWVPERAPVADGATETESRPTVALVACHV